MNDPMEPIEGISLETYGSQISTAWVDALTKDPALASRFGDAVAAERAKLQG